MELSPRAQRVLGCLVEKGLATPQQYPLSVNALRSACNQSTGREPVVDYDEEDIRTGLDELKGHQLVRTEYARGSRVPKSAHRLAEQLDLDEAQQATLALLLLRGPQTIGEIRSRSGRMHEFASLELAEAVLQSLAAHRFGALAALQPRQPGQKEARWAHLLGPEPTSTPAGDEPHRGFHDAVQSGDMEAAIAQLADDVVFRSPAVHQPYEGRAAAERILRAVATVLEDFRYVDALTADGRAALVFEARVGAREVQGLDHLRFDEAGRICELTVMIRPLSGLTAVVEAMRRALAY